MLRLFKANFEFPCYFLIALCVKAHFFVSDLALPSLITFQIENRKIDLKAKSKVGSLDNVKHRAGGGDKKVFNDVEYLRQMSDTTGAQLMAKSATGSRDSSRRESAVQVC